MILNMNHNRFVFITISFTTKKNIEFYKEYQNVVVKKVGIGI